MVWLWSKLIKAYFAHTCARAINTGSMIKYSNEPVLSHVNRGFLKEGLLVEKDFLNSHFQHKMWQNVR